jgi:hypothetical protein
LQQEQELQQELEQELERRVVLVGSFPVVVIQLMTLLSAWLVAPLLLSCACVEPVVAGVVVVVAAVEEPHTVAAAAAAVLDSVAAAAAAVPEVAVGLFSS